MSRKQYLREMGIDIWERRSLRPVISRPQEVVEKPTEPLPEVVPVSTETVPSFRLGLFHYGTVGVCVLLDSSSDMPRRLSDDIARMMGGDVDSLRFQELKWPMLDTEGIDQSADAARQVVTQKFRSLPGKVIVFGRGIAAYFQPLATLEPMSPARVGNQVLLLVDSIEAFMNSADQKRGLLRVLNEWQAMR